MTTTTRPTPRSTTKEFHASVPATTVPGIAEEFNKHGVRYYRTTTGKLFVADTYDKYFKVEKGIVKPKHAKK